MSEIVIQGIETPLRSLPFEFWAEPKEERRLEPLGAVAPTTGLVPLETVYSLGHGDESVVVWGLQRGLNELGWSLAEDSELGDRTEEAVRNFQTNNGLLSDGKFGPVSSAKFADRHEAKVTISIPPGAARGVMAGESNRLIGAVNTSVSGGIDCSFLQRRVYSGDYSDADVVHRAFDIDYQLDLLARSLRERHNAFFGQTGAKTHEKAWRLALLNHNYPSGASTIAKSGISGLSSYWTTPQSWVQAIGAKFSDGVPVRTPLEWCQFYALGNDDHNAPGMVAKFVTWWPA